MISTLVQEPVVEPVSLDTAKAHLRLETTVDDAYVESLIKTARQYVEKVTWRGLLDQTWEVVLPGFPFLPFLVLPKGKLQAVESVKYLDADGVEQTLSTDVYEVDTFSTRGRIILKDGQTWPATRDRWNALRVRYQVGYGPDADDVPGPLKQAILLLVSQMYEHRTPEVIGTMSPVKFAVDALLAPYRLRRF